VQILRRAGRSNADYVSADFRLGMTLAAEHLIRLGHKRIAFVGGARRVTPARDRTEAFREILTRFGLEVGPIVKCLPTREGGASAVADLFKTKAQAPTAVLCHNDLCALGVMLGLADRGIVPGRDVAVIGFDNIPEGDRMTSFGGRTMLSGGPSGDLMRRKSKRAASSPMARDASAGADDGRNRRPRHRRRSRPPALASHQVAGGAARKHRSAAKARHSVELRGAGSAVSSPPRRGSNQIGRKKQWLCKQVHRL
jgi:hypothetical protein